MNSATEPEKTMEVETDDQAASGTTKCSNCKVARTAEHFVGKKGNVVKRCTKCRDKDAKQKKKPEVMERRNKAGREKQYSKTHEEKMRKQNNDAYVARRTENQKKRRARNKGVVCPTDTDENV